MKIRCMACARACKSSWSSLEVCINPVVCRAKSDRLLDMFVRNELEEQSSRDIADRFQDLKCNSFKQIE